jgi:protease-4
VATPDSPGGSAFAAEQIRRELELTQKAGKPVLVSFGDLAASGGYWISMSADEVIADPAAITGSIGVFALLPSADKAWEKLSLHTHGTRTTWLAGAADPRRPLDPRVGQVIQTTIENTYREFVGMAAAARKVTTDQLNEVAQGRVWTGRQALERKLVDRLGSYTDALKAAAELAKLGPEFRVVYVEPEPRRIDRLLNLLLGEAVAPLLEGLGWSLLPGSVIPAALGDVARDLAWLRQASEAPFAAQAHCLCTAD